MRRLLSVVVLGLLGLTLVAACSAGEEYGEPLGQQQLEAAADCTSLPDGTPCGAAGSSICDTANNVVIAVCKAGECKGRQTTPCGFHLCQSGQCLDPCTSGADCIKGAYCDNSGVCKKKKGGGSKCSADNECFGKCYFYEAGKKKSVGICCNSKCDGPCETCIDNEKDLPSGVSPISGTCAIAAKGKNPKGACTAGTGECPAPASCDGIDRNACQQHADPGSPCGTTTCKPNVNGATLTSSSACDQQGACSGGTSAPFTCTTTTCTPELNACATTCTSDTNCVADHFCNSTSSKCEPRKGLGSACASDSECADGRPCVDGFCCSSTCAGICEACDVDNFEGQCSPIPFGIPPRVGDSCGTSFPASEPCKEPACDGVATDTCNAVVGRWKLCGSTSCGENAEGNLESVTKGKCGNGTGVCEQGKLLCNGFKCNAAQTACMSACTTDDDCTDGLRCDGQLCVPLQRCVDEWNVETLGQGPTEQTYCDGYRCNLGQGRCSESCASSDDCHQQEGYLCDGTRGLCVLGGQGAAEDPGSPGCAVGGRSNLPNDSEWFWLVGAACLALRRRKRANEN